MKTNSWMIIGVVIASFTLTSCQSVPTKDLIHKESHNTPKVMIEPLADTDNDSVPDVIDNCPNTPEGVKVDPYGCPVAVNLIGYLTMELRVFFERNGSELQIKYAPEVDKVSEKMRINPEHVIVLSGHTSEIEAKPTLDNKHSLGRERAQVIKNALVQRGVAKDKIYTFDCADNMPIAPSDTEEGRLMNQRIYGKALKADDFYTGGNNEHSLTYYKEFCQQF